MLGAGEMKSLAAASGEKFDRLFLAMMIKHHRGALEMAETASAQGRDPRAIALAEEMERAQREEIKEMQKLQKS